MAVARFGLVSAGLILLAACGGADSPAEQAYDSNAALAENMAKEAERTAEQLEDQAEALREAADNVDKPGEAPR